MQRSGKFSQAIGCQGKTAVVYLYLSMMKKDFEGQPVTKVDRFSAAQRAGMRPGDILLTINGEQVRDLVRSPFRLCRAEAHIPAGGGGAVLYHKKGRVRTLGAVL